MHLTIIFGGALTNGFTDTAAQRPALALFLALKLAADAIMHTVEQKGFND